MWKKLLAALAMCFATAMAMAAVDVNKATEADLDALKGIGPVTSKLILTERKKGPFKDWQDFIARVKGVGESRAAKFSEEGLTVNGQAFKPVATAKKDDKAAAKDAKADAKADKKEAKAEAKADKKEAKAEAAKPAASAAKK
jgi:competence protein ComEA